ncbi:8196_t:CDS:2 [Cetraspora pellucida]|uniref:8196_t:CDS:1 n=1 Tax=Cetraspora pellucida TaxID=1433469 RepID=A0ACA9PPL1_9GLOM|nr:8196_t:CDS:2 [Cetraspora pellucida]
MREEPRLGQRFYLLIKEVKENPGEDTPQIILTRADDSFVRKLLEQEIPQLKEGLVVIHSILRLPGLISKVIVEKGPVAKEKNLYIEPAGTCIGEGGEKAKSVSRLIYPEPSLLLQHEGKMLQKISEYLGINIHVKIMEEMNEKGTLENRGQISQQVGNYKNIDVRIVEEIE